MNIIKARSGISFILKKDRQVKVIDIEGEQVSDFICYNLHDTAEYLSSGRTIDEAETIFLTKGIPFYSNRNNIMFEIIEDTVGRHDFLLSPCSFVSPDHPYPHPGCLEHLATALKEFKISVDDIPTCFNIFMHVDVNGKTGKVSVYPPKSKAGDYVIIEAKMDIIVGLTACSDEITNNYSFKPIGYEILE